MTVRELINKLKKCDPSLEVRTLNEIQWCDDSVNQWVFDLEQHDTSTSGYELQGEVVLLTQE